MNRRELVSYVKGIADRGIVQLREKVVETSEGSFVLAHAKISHQGLEISGFGLARTKDGAIDKALWETIERFNFKTSGFCSADFKPYGLWNRLLAGIVAGTSLRTLDNIGNHSVGCAVHASRTKAADAAVRELIERHTVLAAQLMALPGKRIHQAAFSWNERVVELTSYCWKGPLETYVVLEKIIHIKDGRALYSTGAGVTPESARVKAWLEGIALIENFESDKQDIPDLAIDGRIRDLKHWHMLNLKRKPFFDEGGEIGEIPELDASLRRRDFWVAVKVLGKSLYFARAYSPEIQNLFVGDWTPEKVHPRFRRYWKAGMEPPYAY